MKLLWKPNKGRHANGVRLYLGRWEVGAVEWSMTSRSGPNYNIHCFLPGIRSDIPGEDDHEVAKQKLEGAVKHWLSKIDEAIE